MHRQPGAELKLGLAVPKSWSWSCLFCTQIRAGFRGPGSGLPWVLASAGAPNPRFYPGFLGTRRNSNQDTTHRGREPLIDVVQVGIRFSVEDAAVEVAVELLLMLLLEARDDSMG